MPFQNNLSCLHLSIFWKRIFVWQSASLRAQQDIVSVGIIGLAQIGSSSRENYGLHGRTLAVTAPQEFIG